MMRSSAQVWSDISYFGISLTSVMRNRMPGIRSRSSTRKTPRPRRPGPSGDLSRLFSRTMPYVVEKGNTANY